MSKRKDLTEMRFKYLVAKEFVGTNNRGQALWLCKCDCGKEKIVPSYKLLGNDIFSCGCMQHKYKHGKTNTRIYAIWCTMKARCLNKNSKKYPSYGGRGIQVCEEWKESFDAFYEYVSKLNHFEEDGYTLNRINNDGDYEPNNVEWANHTTQANNTRANRKLEYDGESHTIAEWSRIKNISKSALYHRLHRGWDIKDALEYSGR